MSDKTELTTGDNAEDVIAGKRNQQQRNDPSQNVSISSSSNELLQLWMKVLDLGQQIRELTFRIDNLPDRVTRLENLEVVIGPGPKMKIRPAPDSFNIPTRVLVITLIVITLVVAAAVGWLIYRQVIHA